MKQKEQPYGDVIRVLRHYWRIYGGAAAVLRSPYLHVAVAITLCCYGLWTQRGWWSGPIAVLPNLLGFSIGSFAILLAFGDDAFRKLIAGPDGSNHSPYMGFCATFFHFILAQVVALLAAIVFSSEPLSGIEFRGYARPILGAIGAAAWFLGFLAFAYAVVLAVATSVSLFRLARMFDKFIQKQRDDEQDGEA